MLSHAQKEGYAGKAPNITLAGFEDIMSPLTSLAHSRGVSYNPLITAATRRGWEAYAASNVALLNGPTSLEQSVDGSWIVSDGIYDTTSTGEMFYDSGFVPHSSYPDLLAPIWQISPISSNAPAVMYNEHSRSAASRTRVIDRVIATKTGGFTDIIHLVQDEEMRPSTTWFTPVLDIDDEDKVLGLIAVAFSWDAIFKHALPSYLGGLYLVLQTDTQSFSFLFSHGEVKVVGSGDLHDRKYNPYRKIISNPMSEISRQSVTNFTITMYPTDELYDRYVTDYPLIIACSEAALMLFTAALVAGYFYILTGREAMMVSAIESAEVMAELAKEEVEIKKNFVRYISHEIRTPLNTVKMGLEVLKQDIIVQKTPRELIRTMDDIKQSCAAALEVVNDFLLFDKIVSSKLELELNPLNIVKLVNTSVQPFFIQARRCRTTLSIVNEIGDSKFVGHILGDKHKLTQVLRNMLSNALKFTPSGGTIELKIRRVNTSDDICQYVIDVTDSGVGISKDNQEKLFKDIIQFNPGKLQAGGGTGLGMYISRNIMLMHDGDLSVRSDGEGCGSTFSMSLPMTIINRFNLSHSGSQESLTHSNKISVGESAQSSTSSLLSESTQLEHRPIGSPGSPGESSQLLRILVVDDATSNRKMLCRMLIRPPFSCICEEAEDGRTAVEKIKQSVWSSEQEMGQDSSQNRQRRNYDVILMDFTMPHMNGPEATKIIRDFGYKGMIVGATGHAGDSERDLFISNGADTVMVKPIEVDELKTIITKAMMLKI
eukprot:CAMPEP_0182422232 /NCGR_PEP_ID=MMETSP1167-20130531/7852_1 /TAXON_ID=2988 /ORGANISM="Mallomonas Sp, Strain CCMP3275" /LENGTH=769 /DNA_ID=CAMNT_0024600093 /DNA_START=268 /DNA_END=2577 /DNA_ORIENTATION=-